MEVMAGQGMTINDFCDKLVKIAKALGHKVKGTFNGKSIIARPTSSPEDLCVIYDLTEQVLRISVKTKS